MTKPDEAVRKIIDDTVGPRLDDYQTYLAAAGQNPVPVARADLLYVWDEYRTEHLDWATLGHPLGHGHPIVMQSVQEHHRYYGHTGPQDQHVHRWPVEYAKRLSKQFTGQDETPRRVLFCEGEREAVTVAVRSACAATGQHPSNVVVLADHPAYDWLGDTNRYPWGFDPADVRWQTAGALLIDPVSPQAQVMPPDQLRRWALAARAASVPVIVDESRSGFGRLGVMWAQQRTGLIAEMTVLGGPVGGSYPLGAVVAPARFFPADPDVSAQAAHPVSCCAGAAHLTATELGVLDYMQESGKRLTDGLGELVDQFPHHLAARHGEALLHGLRFHTADAAHRFTLDCRPRGLYVAPPVGDTVVVAPALITSTNEMTRGVDLIAATLMGWDDEAQPGHSPEERP